MNQAKTGVMSSSSRKCKRTGEHLTRSLRAVQDIDKLIMRAEEALQESEEHYSTLIGSLADAVFEFKGGVLVWCNDRVEEIYGYTRDELIGKGARFFFPEGIGASEFAKKISAAIKERGLFRGTARVKKKDSTLADIEYSISRTPTKDPIKVIVVARDITERKQAERERERLLIELAEKTRELEQIVYVASHDLRSPLVNIQGFTRELDESFKQVYEIFDSKAVPSAVRKKLAPLLDEDIVASFEFQVKESGVKIRVEELPPCYGDETQINQVLSNLL
ncbi:MAG: PAS domain S-box protein, partial [Chloroflexi bacterium]|nr:PAS domain S-box protein [Chloroflexota bacterium]